MLLPQEFNERKLYIVQMRLPIGRHASKWNFVAIPILILLCVFPFGGCSTRSHVPIEALAEAPCSSATGVVWAGPTARDHRSQLGAWCRSVGNLMISTPAVPPVDVSASGLVVLTWNQHVGHGDLHRLLRSYVDQSPVVALVQEVARESSSVPLEIPGDVRAPGRIGPAKQKPRDIASIARELNLSLVYLPSMPNGSRTREDRGCAILSTLPVSEVIGIELPWVSQRRVAVMATVTAIHNGVPLRLRVMSMHLDNRRRRSGQAAAVAKFLEQPQYSDSPIIIGADLNAWFGVADGSVEEIDRVVPRIRECGNLPTFRFLGLRLDHLFTTLPKRDRVRCFVGHDRFGSDHYPIVLQLFNP